MLGGRLKTYLCERNIVRKCEIKSGNQDLVWIVVHLMMIDVVRKMS